MHSWTAGSGLWLGGLAALLAVVARRSSPSSAAGEMPKPRCRSPSTTNWLGVPHAAAVDRRRADRGDGGGAVAPDRGGRRRAGDRQSLGRLRARDLGGWAVGVAVVGARGRRPVPATRWSPRPCRSPRRRWPCSRSLLSDALTRRPGFERGAGTWAVWALVALLLLAAPAFAMLAARLRTVDAASWRSGWTSRTAPSGAAGRGPGSAAAATVRRPPIAAGRQAGRERAHPTDPGGRREAGPGRSRPRARSSPGRCATPAWRSSTPGCTRRRR